MPRYEVDTDQGRYEIETDQPVPDDARGQVLLQRLLARQLLAQRASQNTAGSFATQLVGGVRDAAQQFIDLPAEILNAISLFVSPDPPGGPRRRVIPEAQLPQLPNTVSPQTFEETATRWLANLGANLALTPAFPGVRRWFQSPSTPMLFEPGRAVARGAPASFPKIPTVAPATEILQKPMSEGAMRLAQLFDIPFDTRQIASMSHTQALAARRRILSRIPDYDVAELRQQGGPLGELLEAIDQQILRYR